MEHNVGDLAVDEFAAGQLCALLCVFVGWGRVDYRIHTSVTVGALDRVYIGYLGFLNYISLFIFIDLYTNLQNSYLELGVSKWGDPNFVGFIIKYSI